MAFTCGFYDSLDHDRLYNAIQMSQIFDGIINDGVYETIGDKFRVTARSTPSREVNIGTGRAWFNHTWNLNDSIYILDCGQSEILLDRIDAVVIEVDRRLGTRNNSLKVIHGTPSSKPQRPKLSKTDDLYQHPLAYITRKAGNDAITTANITNMIGTSQCPFVIGVIKTMTIDMFVDQWSAEWNEWINAKKNTVDKEWADKKADINQQWYEWWTELKNVSGSELIDWIDINQDKFIKWFNQLQVMLDGDVATNLASEILKLNEVFDTLAKEHKMYRYILDSDGNPVLDDDNDPIMGTVVFCTPPCECKK